MIQKSKKFKISKKALLLAGLAVVVLAGILFVVFHNPKSLITIPSTSPPTSTKTSNSDKQEPVSGNTGNVATNSSNKPTSASESTELMAPSNSTFVSNHRPGQNGTPTTERSVCVTTPGATCYILFTKDGVTKKLEAQVADTDGAAYWDWDVKQAGLSAGSWQISAVATLNGQTKTASDAIPLEVQS